MATSPRFGTTPSSATCSPRPRAGRAPTAGGTCAYGGSSPYKPYPEGSNNVFRDNVFQRGASDPVTGAPGHCGYWYGIADLDVDQRGNEWTGNRWDMGELMPVDG